MCLAQSRSSGNASLVPVQLVSSLGLTLFHLGDLFLSWMIPTYALASFAGLSLGMAHS